MVVSSEYERRSIGPSGFLPSSEDPDLGRPRGSGTSTSRRLATLTADLSSLHRGHDLSPICARRGAERNDPAKSLTVWYAR